MASRTVRRLKQSNGNGNKERWRCAPVDTGAPFIVVTPPPPQQQLQQSSNAEGVLCSVTATAAVRQRQQDDGSVDDRWPRRDATPPRGSVCFFKFGIWFFDCVLHLEFHLSCYLMVDDFGWCFQSPCKVFADLCDFYRIDSTYLNWVKYRSNRLGFI